MDLDRLGTALRERREALGIPRTELARRVGVTPTYIWLVENAKPRQSGQPSRPAEHVIERWTRALGMDERYTRQALRLAGYGEQQAPVDTAMLAAAPAVLAAPTTVRPMARARREPFGGESSHAELLPFAQAPVRFAQPPELQSEVLVQQVRDILETARAADRWAEVTTMLESFLDWLRFRLERAE
ncbi:MAG TPA: helix-turn-helix transcriptional regulator [Chloroflexota bacterium]|nr:helix-turn-helix transcriptional regulator [Chloroflexota bacterium]